MTERMKQTSTIEISDALLLQLEGRSVLDEHGHILTWHARVVDGQAEVTITRRDPGFLERVRWAIRPKPSYTFL